MVRTDRVFLGGRTDRGDEQDGGLCTRIGQESTVSRLKRQERDDPAFPRHERLPGRSRRSWGQDAPPDLPGLDEHRLSA